MTFWRLPASLLGRCQRLLCPCEPLPGPCPHAWPQAGAQGTAPHRSAAQPRAGGAAGGCPRLMELCVPSSPAGHSRSIPDSFLGHVPYDTYGYGSFGECHALPLTSLPAGAGGRAASPPCPSPQRTAPPAAPRPPRAAWALQRSPTDTWVSPAPRRAAEPTCQGCPEGTDRWQLSSASLRPLAAPVPPCEPALGSPRGHHRLATCRGASRGAGGALGPCPAPVTLAFL